MAPSAHGISSFPIPFLMRALIIMMLLVVPILCALPTLDTVNNDASGYHEPVAHGHHHTHSHSHRAIYEAPYTNSCTVTWGSSPVEPTKAIYERVSSLWMVDAGLTIDSQEEDDVENLDDVEFEAYFAAFRMNKIQQAIHWAECVMNDWPELDLQWCLAEWHDGKLIPDTKATLGETCYWNCPCYGWAYDSVDTASVGWFSLQALTDGSDPCLGLAPRTWLAILFIVLTIGLKDSYLAPKTQVKGN